MGGGMVLVEPMGFDRQLRQQACTLLDNARRRGSPASPNVAAQLRDAVGVLSRSVEPAWLALAESAAALEHPDAAYVRYQALLLGQAHAEARTYHDADGEAREAAAARLGLALGWHVWGVRAEGIDVALRAMLHQRAFPPRDAADDGRRATAARELRARLLPDRDGAILLAALAAAMAELRDWLDWGLLQLPALDAPATRRAVLANPGWAKLAQRLHQLADAAARVAAHPELVKLFPVL